MGRDLFWAETEQARCLLFPTANDDANVIVPTGAAMSEERLERIEHLLENSEGRLGRMERRLETLETGQDRLGRQIDEHHHQMLMLHEQTHHDIAALAPDFAPIRREFTEADNALHDKLDQRLTPVEAWVRSRKQGRQRKR
jgi:hypothetical protein